MIRPYDQTFAMVQGSRACQSPCVYTSVNPAEELDKLAGQGPARKSNVRSNKAHTPPEAPTPTLVSPISEDLFTKFIKVFIETTQVREQLEPQERAIKARTSETYFGNYHMDCYHFCQQCEDYFETSGAIGMNCIPFVATFFRGAISLR